MSLIEQVSELITHGLTSDLSEYIADQFGLDSSEVSIAIKNYLGNNSTPVMGPPRNSPKESPPIKNSVSGVKTCQFKITRGENQGKMCDTTIRGESDYCSKHKNRKTVQNKKSITIIKNAKANCWMISNTKFAIKSARDKTVVGKVVGPKIIKLNALDKKKVRNLNLKLVDDE